MPHNFEEKEADLSFELKYDLKATNECLNLIQAWISNHMPDTMRNEITYPFPNFNGVVCEWIGKFIPYAIIDFCNHLPILGYG